MEENPKMKLLVKLTTWLLKHKKLDKVSKLALLNAMIVSVNALPIKKIIDFDPDGTIKIEGKYLDVDKSRQIRESAISLKDNQARQLIRDQIARAAIEVGVYNSQNFEQLFFSKAVFWIIQQEEDILSKIAKEF